ncbi:MAG TPA: nucleoside triphosphate pyrophosphohydrolase [Gemmatimonadales bacterium]|nr:nucleoside triphosphate pyrophosphohydrolase [Gemmatimonadales bacterium]
MQQPSALARAQAMVRELRIRCPWDRAQTRETIRPYLIEEVFELDHALAEGEPAAIREEVADLLLHLAWQLVLAEERSEFTADEVAGDLERKMRRRHPHLFSLGPAERWERLKHSERPRGALDGLPLALPSLLLAYRLQERAATVGFDWPDPSGPAAKIREELAEVEVAAAREPTLEEPQLGGPSGEPVLASPAPALVEEVGDLLFAVVNLARKLRVDPSIALERANRKFLKRFQALELIARQRGIDVATAGLEVLDGIWDEVKRSPSTDTGDVSVSERRSSP